MGNVLPDVTCAFVRVTKSDAVNDISSESRHLKLTVECVNLKASVFCPCQGVAVSCAAG